MTEKKTRLEEDLEAALAGRKRWGALTLILLLLLLAVLFYTVNVGRELFESQKRIEALQLEIDSLMIKMESLRVEAMKCKEKESSGQEPENTDTGRSGESTSVPSPVSSPEAGSG